MGWHPDEPGGDQTESKGLSGKTKTASQFMIYFLHPFY